MLTIIVYAFVIVLLPIVPAVVIYKVIPPPKGAETDSVEGPFHGLNIKLKGAFAGYFIVLVSLAYFVTDSVDTAHGREIERLNAEQEFEYWTVRGSISSEITDPEGSVQISIIPPRANMFPDGSFEIDNLAIPKEGAGSTVVFSHNEHDEVIHLGLDAPDLDQEREYAFTFGSNQIITISPAIKFDIVFPGFESDATTAAAEPPILFQPHSADTTDLIPLPATGDAN